ncbi:PI-PLC domain-containing protein [Streptomyces sp. NPDC050738]|uniref:PI-PLC domain-containing protein n=1 Tax=Streptomyces sp. NPDC050738 TaxID=3154744 RepID=UPI0034369A65
MGVPASALKMLRPALCVLAVLCIVVVAGAATARSTVLSAGFYRAALDDQRAWNRMYDEVLVDPQITPLTRNLLGQLPVPEAILTSNLKLVLPPETLRALTDRQISEVIGYLRGEHATLRLTVDVRALSANAGTLAQIYFGDLVASLQQQPEPDFPAFVEGIDAAARSIAAGQPPAGLPQLTLSRDEAVTAADGLLRVVPESDRAALRPEVVVALQNGDVATALAAVGPAAFSGRTQNAAAQLREASDGGTWNITADLDTSQGGLATVDQVRSATRLALDVVEPVAAVLGLLALAALWLAGPASLSRRLTLLGWTLAAGGLLYAVAVALLRWRTGGTVVEPAASWPHSVARLVDDVQRAAVDRALTVALVTALLPVAAGALLVALAWVLRTRPALGAAPHRPAWAAAGAASFALAGIVLVPLAFAGQGQRICQGSSRLCDRPYDEVAQVTSHNAMSTTADRFIGPLQDPLIVGQLNDGVRALQIDTYHWESPEDVTARLHASGLPPEQQRQLAAAINLFNPAREGTWLCHAVCRAGAIPLVPALEQIGGWLRQNPSEILTLIVQDDISGEDTERAFDEAGLKDLLYVPDKDPDRPWPTMGEMIDSGKRLVVFAEQADGPAPWYRNFYRYGMETPFSFQSPEELSCVPHRGGTGKRLFLLNHFITVAGGSRLDAGKINTRAQVLERAHACEKERGRPVNFIAVDYTTIGDTRGAVDALNAERGQ